MKFSEAGFLRWFNWALFSWRGDIKRLPFLAGFLILVLFAGPYTNAAAQLLALHVLPPAGGLAPDLDYVRSLLGHPIMVPALLPIFYVYAALDIKRLKSIGLAPAHCLALALLIAALATYGPRFLPGIIQLVAMTSFACHAILAVIPASEDRLHPLERKARTWKAIASGDGSPRRLTGKDIKHWHVVRRQS